MDSQNDAIVEAEDNPAKMKKGRCESIAAVIDKYSIKDSIRELSSAVNIKKFIDGELRAADDHRVYPNDMFRNKLNVTEVAAAMSRRALAATATTPERAAKKQRTSLGQGESPKNPSASKAELSAGRVSNTSKGGVSPASATSAGYGGNTTPKLPDI